MRKMECAGVLLLMCNGEGFEAEGLATTKEREGGGLLRRYGSSRTTATVSGCV